jgi:hypothetical protein
MYNAGQSPYNRSVQSEYLIPDQSDRKAAAKRPARSSHKSQHGRLCAEPRHAGAPRGMPCSWIFQSIRRCPDRARRHDPEIRAQRIGPNRQVARERPGLQRTTEALTKRLFGKVGPRRRTGNASAALRMDSVSRRPPERCRNDRLPQQIAIQGDFR